MSAPVCNVIMGGADMVVKSTKSKYLYSLTGWTTPPPDTPAAGLLPPAHRSAENSSHLTTATHSSLKITDHSSHGIGDGKPTPTAIEYGKETKEKTIKDPCCGASAPNVCGGHMDKEKSAPTIVAKT